MNTLWRLNRMPAWLVCTTVALVLLLVAGRWWLTPSSPYYLAVVIPLSGPQVTHGADLLSAVQYHIDQINAQGGIEGRAIALKVFEAAAEPEAVQRLSQVIAADPEILLVLGYISHDAARVAGPVYRQARLPVITVAAGDNAITRDNPWFFMLAPNHRFQGIFTAHYLHNVFAPTTVGVIYDADASGSALFRHFSETIQALGIDIVYQRKVDRRHSELDATLRRIAADFNTGVQPDILYLATEAGESARLLGLIQSAHDRLVLVCSAVCVAPSFSDQLNHDPRERAQPGYYSDDLYVVSPFIEDIANQQAQTFQQQFRRLYPSVRSMATAAYAYDAAQLAVAALRTLPSVMAASAADGMAARDAIREALGQRYHRSRALPGVTGLLYFDQQGNLSPTLAVGYYVGQTLISAPVQYRVAEETNDLAVHALLDDIWSGDAFIIDDSVLRRLRVVYTGIDIAAVNQLDTLQSRYNLNFFLWFRFHGAFADTDIHFGKVAKPLSLGVPLLDQTSQGITTRVYQVNGEFEHRFEFGDYPFDRQILPIRFHHNSERADRLLYVNDTLGLAATSGVAVKQNPLLDGISDWRLENILLFQNQISPARHLNRVSIAAESRPLVYSQFNAVIEIRRHAWRVLVKNLFPILLLVLMAYLAYFTPADKAQERISLGSSALITTAFFHLQLITAMSVDDLMTIDYFFFAVYLLSVMVILISMVNAYYHEKIKQGRKDAGPRSVRYRQRIKRLDLFGRAFHPSLLVVLVVSVVYVYH